MPAAQALRGFSRSTAEPNSSPKPKNPLLLQGILWSTPNGIRTRAATLRASLGTTSTNGDGRRRLQFQGFRDRPDIGEQARITAAAGFSRVFRGLFE